MKSIYCAKLFGLILLGVFMGACSHNDWDNEFPAEEKPRHTCKMILIGGVNGFDGSRSDAKAVSSTWQHGDKIYITFYNGTTLVPGEAVYNSTSGWTVSYDGNLAVGSNQKCEVRFFVNATFADSYWITLNANTEIYEDVEGTYSYDDGTLRLQALLKPKTGRIRFTGTSGSKITLIGITTYSTYAPNANQFTTSMAMIKETVTNGSTPYVYGYFTNADRGLCLIGEDFAFTRNCTDEVLKTGGSGYMAIPSESSHNNWSRGANITFDNWSSEIQLRMLPVAEHPSGFFLMAETETTYQFYCTVMGTGYYYPDSTKPMNYVSQVDIQSFIRELQNKTGLQFSLPTVDQWLYAAKGGNKSQGYRYAGGNMAGDVAWYAGNSDKPSPVKTKQPNELGLYDMSGNVAECTKTSPGGRYCAMGGCYATNETELCLPSSGFHQYDYYGRSLGFRLILTCP